MAIYITQIEKHRFVCGLFWQSLSRPRELKKEAASLAKKIDFDLMVLRKDHSTAQAGFAQSRDGARRMMYSLGAVVSKTLALEGAYYDGQQQRVHNWLGAFKLPDGMWAYFAARDASFLPNGDFAGTKEEVLERLHGDYGLGGWNVVIGDAELEDYGFHNFNAKRIEDMLPRRGNGQIRTHKWWGLRPVTTKLTWPPVAIAASLIVIAGVGGTTYWKKLQREKEEAERARAMEAVRQQLLGNAAPSDIPHPWASRPLPAPTAQACIEHFTHVTAGGWRLDQYVCTPDQVTYSWSRQNSNIDFLLAQLPKAVVDINGEKATYSVPLALKSGKDEALLEQKQLLEPLISRMQLLNLTPNVRLVPVQAPVGQAAAQNQAALPNWKTFAFTVSANGIPPAEVATILDRPGVRIERLVYGNGAWSIEGVMYAK
ncbi:type 4b pilus protein PilO2 [Herbaspirillum sp. GCM10030257]|uniref:type 4b pilus protein PilO2 n=1 Tax=Herbaspirillum sp. GCM10030257 TaxID=3273393 RepID=UPI00361FDE38